MPKRCKLCVWCAYKSNRNAGQGLDLCHVRPPPPAKSTLINPKRGGQPGRPELAVGISANMWQIDQKFALRGIEKDFVLAQRLALLPKWNQVVGTVSGRYPRRKSGVLLSTVKRRNLSRFGHVCRHDTLPKIMLQGTVDGSRRRGRPRKSRKDDIKEWTGQSTSSLLRIAYDRGRWAVIV